MDQLRRFLSTLDSAHTRRAYKTDLEHFFGGKPVSASDCTTVRPEDVRTFGKKLRASELSQSTKQRRLSALRSFFDWLCHEGVRSSNPARAASVEIVSDSRADEKKWLTEPELSDLLDAANEVERTGRRDRALILMTVYGTLRRQDVASLDVGDVRPLSRHWVVDISDGSGTGGYVRIPQVVVDAVESLKEKYNIGEGPLWRPVRDSVSSNRLSPDGIYKAIQRVADQAGVSQVNIDSLRRTGLRIMYKAGASLQQLRSHARLKHLNSLTEVIRDLDRGSTLHDSAVDHLEANFKNEN